MSDSIINQLQKFKNINFVKADIADDFEEGVENSSKVILTAKIGQTDSKLYKK